MENAGFFSRMFPVWNVSRHRAPGKERHVAGVVGNTDFCPGSLRAVTAKPSPWGEKESKGWRSPWTACDLSPLSRGEAC